MGLRFSVGSAKRPRRLSRAGRLPGCALSPAATVGKPLKSRAAQLAEARSDVRTAGREALSSPAVPTSLHRIGLRGERHGHRLRMHGLGLRASPAEPIAGNRVVTVPERAAGDGPHGIGAFAAAIDGREGDRGRPADRRRVPWWTPAPPLPGPTAFRSTS